LPPILPRPLYPEALPLALALLRLEGSLLAVLQVWQRQELREQEPPARVQRAEQDHKSPHPRGLQLVRVLADHPKVQAVARAVTQEVQALLDLVQRAAYPIARVIRQAQDRRVQVLAAQLHPLGVKIQVKKRLIPAMATRHTPKGVKTYHPVRSKHLKLPRKHLLHPKARQVPIKAPTRSHPHQALRLKHPNQGPLAQLQALSRPLAQPAITAFRPILHKPMPEDPRH
jgi:hypothetical protein